MPQQYPLHNNKNLKFYENVAILIKNFWSVSQPTMRKGTQKGADLIAWLW
jgi:hypothetical protein